jgi:hypothetical protein
MTGNYIHLISMNDNNIRDYFPIKYSINAQILDINSNTSIEIIRNIDTIIINGLIIDKRDYYNLKNLQITIGNSIIWNVPLILFNSIREIDENHILLKIDNIILGKNNNQDFLIKNRLEIASPWGGYYAREIPSPLRGGYYALEIPVVNLVYQNIFINITAKTDNIPIKLLYENIYYNTNERLKLLKNHDYDISINQYQIFNFKSKILLLNPILPSSAVYVISKDKIINYQLSFFDGHVHTEYDRYKIIYYNSLIKKLNRRYKYESYKTILNKVIKDNNIIESILGYIIFDYYLYCFPFGIDENDNLTNINFNNINDVKIKLLTENDIYDGYYIIKNYNILKIKDGISDILFD